MSAARMGAAIRSMLTRGRLSAASYFLGAGGAPLRTVLVVQGLASETFKGVELILPYGMSALPSGQTADFLLFQVMGARSHKVAIGADDPALRIPDLQLGEFGFRDARGQQIVFRLDRVELTTPLKAVVTTTGDIDATAGGAIKATATGEITLNSSAKIRLAAPIVEVQTKDWRLDVGGYAYQFQYPGAGSEINYNTWFVGATIVPGVNNFSPPGVFNGP
jgi:phage gp45-like